VACSPYDAVPDPAAEVLSNEKKRREYDEYIDVRSHQPPAFGGANGIPSFFQAAFSDPWDVFAKVSQHQGPIASL